MLIINIIDKKKNAEELTYEEIDFLINGFVKKEVKDYQMSAFLMAIVLNGMSFDETFYLTKSMIKSGIEMDLSSIPGIKVDKHSTGGIGDKTTIVLGPIIASLGIPFSKMSGKGLSFTGGTLDKLESIPGFRINLSFDEFVSQVKKINIAVIGQDKNIVVADKYLYSLRSVTATVKSIPLIVSSIMSKKIALGTDTILIDVKCGNGAFCKTKKEAKTLGAWLIKIGQKFNKDTRIQINDMNEPIGKSIGNKIEILEAMKTLQGKGTKDFEDLVMNLCITMLFQAKKTNNYKKAFKMVQKTIKEGKAFNKFKEWIKFQGGDLDFLLSDNFFNPKYQKDIKASEDGFLNLKSSKDFGLIALELGAGRKTKNDIIDYEAGIYLHKKTNDKVKKNDILFTLYSSEKINTNILKEIENKFEILNKKTKKIKIFEKIER